MTAIFQTICPRLVPPQQVIRKRKGLSRRSHDTVLHLGALLLNLQNLVVALDPLRAPTEEHLVVEYRQNRIASFDLN